MRHIYENMFAKVRYCGHELVITSSTNSVGVITDQCFIYMLLAPAGCPMFMCTASTYVWFRTNHYYPYLYFTGAGAIIKLPQCLWTNHEGYVSIPHQSTHSNSDMVWTEQKTTKTKYFMGSPVYQPLVPWCCIPGQGPSCNPGLS